MNDLSQDFSQFLMNPDAARAELDRLDAEDGVKEFIRQGWFTVMPRSTPFLTNWHIDIICEHLEAISRGELHRVIFNLPPRHMKSTGINVFWPAWDWIRNPGRQFLFTTYQTRLTIRDSVRCRRLIESPWYQSNWGDKFKLTKDQNSTLLFVNDQHGYRLSTSLQGGITGDGGDIIVIDDPHNAMDIHSPGVLAEAINTYSESLVSRLNNQDTGAMILTMQRLGEKDLTGHILETEGDWVHVCLPARYEPDHPYHYFDDPRTRKGEPLWPDRFSDKGLKRLERPMGPRVSAGQLQQRPAPKGGAIFKRKWFKIVSAIPQESGFWVRAWDLAGTEVKKGQDPDWSVGLKMVKIDDDYYIVDVNRFQEEPGPTEKQIIKTARKDGIDVDIDLAQDPGQAGKAQVNYLTTKLAGFVVKSSTETGSKQKRAEAVASQASQGHIFLLEGDWNEEFINEMVLFPAGKWDDQVDACSRAFHSLIEERHTASARSFKV